MVRKLLGICSILQLGPVHCMALLNISSLRETLPSHNSCSSTKLTAANCIMLAWFGIISENCAVTPFTIKKLYTAECLRRFETKHITCTVCATYWGKMHCIAKCLKYYIATITFKPHGMRSIFEIDFCKLDATLRLAEARSCKWNGICNMLELSSAHCTYCMVFVARSAKIGKLHSAYNIVKPTFVNCAELAAVWKQHV